MANMAENRKAIWSAVASGIIAFLSSLVTAWQGENEGFDTITTGQWNTAVVALLMAVTGAGGVTYQVRNRPPTPSGSSASADDCPARPSVE